MIHMCKRDTDISMQLRYMWSRTGKGFRSLCFSTEVDGQVFCGKDRTHSVHWVEHNMETQVDYDEKY